MSFGTDVQNKTTSLRVLVSATQDHPFVNGLLHATVKYMTMHGTYSEVRHADAKTQNAAAQLLQRSSYCYVANVLAAYRLHLVDFESGIEVTYTDPRTDENTIAIDSITSADADGIKDFLLGLFHAVNHKDIGGELYYDWFGGSPIQLKSETDIADAIAYLYLS